MEIHPPVTNAKFSIGQKVMLTSKFMPEANGEYVVSGAFGPAPVQISERTGLANRENAYLLDGLDGFWVESALSTVPE